MGLCTGCGTCIGLCPNEAIKMVIDNNEGLYIPVINDEKCSNCGLCVKVCPGHSIDADKLNLDIFGKQPVDILLGNCIRCYTGHATDYKTRYNSASGGLITALLIYLVESGYIDGALITGMNANNPLEPYPFIAKSRAEIISAAKSKYCPVPANIALKDIINDEGKFAVVGLPCHIQGIRKAEALNDKLKEKIILHLGLFCCGHTDTFLGTEFILKKYKVNKDDVNYLGYRGEGWPGYMKIKFNDNSVKLIPLHEYIIYHNYGFFSPKRCALCYDGLNDFADISFGDAWRPEFISDSLGSSIIISRTQHGEYILQDAIEKNIITLTDIECNKVKIIDRKKKAYHMKSILGKILGRKSPKYNVRLPYILFTFPPPLIFYLCMSLSGRRFWPLISPLANTFEKMTKFGKKLLKR